MNLDANLKKLHDKWVDHKFFVKLGNKTTICLLQLHNGFEIVGTSACVDPGDFDREIGEHFALKDALDQLETYTGFYRQIKGGQE